ncbi:MAG TPA: VWA domain-containing protein [Flavobacteriaceae bacterium]|nr:VWA domain-containing protein [Flavobacteriaceae bacterium]
MYQFEQSIYLYALATIPVLLLLYLWVIWWRRRAQQRFATRQMLDKLAPNRSVNKMTIKVISILLVLILILIGLANPRMGSKTEKIDREGVDVVFALDVSKSMLAEDITPNRLVKSKHIINQIINSLQNDRVGIIGYAGSAFPQVPLTTDFATAKVFLNNMHTDMVSSEGTAIAEAVNLANRFYSLDNHTSRVLILLSDGEDHEGGLESVIEEAKAQNVQIITVGVATEQGAPIPIKENGVLQHYLRDRNNEQVISRLGLETMQKLASETNGAYVDGENTQEVVDTVHELLYNMDKTMFQSEEYTEFKSYFQWFAGLAILLLALESLFLNRKTGWLRRLNLFNEARKNEE